MSTNASVRDAKPVRFHEFVFDQLCEWRKAGLKTALLTLVNIEGSSPRPIGSQIAVNEHGEYCGLISGGCLEAALVAEAQVCIHQKAIKCLRYGRDSDFFDIQLPCGSGVDILIQPLTHKDNWLDHIHDLHRSRKQLSWQFALASGKNTVVLMQSDSAHVECVNKNYSRELMNSEFSVFQKIFSPRHRIVVVGGGEIFDYFLQLTRSFDFEVLAYSNQVYKSSERDFENKPNKSCQRIDSWEARILDRWTSLIILSHDHSYEQSILKQALTTDVGFISALGSKNTHAKRLQLLLDSGVEKCRALRIKGPSGLDIGAQSPPEIALSVLAQVIAHKNDKYC